MELNTRDANQQLDFLDHDQFELRIIGKAIKGSKNKVYIGRFDDRKKAFRAIADIKLGRDKFWNCYVNLNQLKETNPANKFIVGGRAATDKDIARRTTILVDFDPVRPSVFTSSTDNEKRFAKDVAKDVQKFLDSQGFTSPMVADSGNGYHLLYAIDGRVDDGGLVRDLLLRLQQMFGTPEVKIDRSVHNASRIVKLYGTQSQKGREVDGRPFRKSAVLTPSIAKPTKGSVILYLADQVEKPKFQESTEKYSNNHQFLREYCDHHGFRYHALDGGHGDRLRIGFPDAESHDACPHARTWAGVDTDGTIRAGCHHNTCDMNWDRMKAAHPVPEEIKSYEPDVCDWRLFHEGGGFLPFPTLSLPDVLAEFVETHAIAQCCDESFVALPLLSFLGSAIGTQKSIYPRKRNSPSWEVFPCIWTAIVGDSGCGKSPALSIFFKLANMVKREGEGWDFNDVTYEKLGDLFKENDKGLLLMPDEIASFINATRPGGGSSDMSSRWLSLDGSKAYQNHRIGRGSVRIDNAMLTVFGGLQPQLMADIFSGNFEFSGMASRFFFTYPEKRLRKLNHDAIDEGYIDAMRIVVDRLRNPHHEMDAATRDEYEYVFTPNAQNLYDNWHDEIERICFANEGLQAAIIAKTRTHAAAIAVIFQSVVAPNEAIDVDILEKAIEIAMWCCNETRRCSGAISRSGPLSSLCLIAIELAKRKEGSITLDELRRSTRKIGSRDEAKAIFEELEEKQIGKIEKSGRGFRFFIFDGEND